MRYFRTRRDNEKKLEIHRKSEETNYTMAALLNGESSQHDDGVSRCRINQNWMLLFKWNFKHMCDGWVSVCSGNEKIRFVRIVTNRTSNSSAREITSSKPHDDFWKLFKQPDVTVISISVFPSLFLLLFEAHQVVNFPYWNMNSAAPIS